jgi:hypothetical protein
MKAILEIDLPDCCDKCTVYYREDNYCIVTEEVMWKKDEDGRYTNKGYERRGDGCPLIIKEGN